ncbi:hypothetical protein NC652_013039 [Populus alba x Populus x berolinensis]|nr:hypothetical protein NC652_013039 [Populus alba x Populus x berolinensis]
MADYRNLELAERLVSKGVLRSGRGNLKKRADTLLIATLIYELQGYSRFSGVPKRFNMEGSLNPDQQEATSWRNKKISKPGGR